MRRHHIVCINTAFVKVRRGSIKMSQKVAANRADITQKHWSNIENSRANPSINVVIRMANALKCRPDEMLTSTADMSIQYLERRIQETIQEIDPLDTKEFLKISKMLGYFECERPAVGYAKSEQIANDDLLLTQYKTLHETALMKQGVDSEFLKFLMDHRSRLRNLLPMSEQQKLEQYLIERGVTQPAIPEETYGT